MPLVEHQLAEEYATIDIRFIIGQDWSICDVVSFFSFIIRLYDKYETHLPV